MGVPYVSVYVSLITILVLPNYYYGFVNYVFII